MKKTYFLVIGFLVGSLFGVIVPTILSPDSAGESGYYLSEYYTVFLAQEEPDKRIIDISGSKVHPSILQIKLVSVNNYPLKLVIYDLTTPEKNDTIVALDTYGSEFMQEFSFEETKQLGMIWGIELEQWGGIKRGIPVIVHIKRWEWVNIFEEVTPLE